MTEAVLALDQGSHASRAALYDAAGRELAVAQVAIATQRPAPTRVEHDALEVLASLEQAVRNVLTQVDVRVIAAGLATQRSSVVCCRRKSLAPLTPVLSWQDRRNAAWLESLAARATEVRSLTGLPLSPHYGASKLRWCLENIPEVQAAAAADDLLLLPLASFLCARLTGGEARVDPANASRTLLWSLHDFDWSEPLLRAFAIERRCLPRCVATVYDYGELRAAPGVRLGACTGDQSAVPSVHGAPDVNAVYVNVGTGAFIQRAVRSAQIAPLAHQPLLTSVLQGGGRERWYSLEGTVNGAGSALQWLCERQRVEERELWTWLESPEADAAEIPVFYNSIGGRGSPWWDSGGEPRFDAPLGARAVASADASASATAGPLFAAVLESIAFMLARNFELMQRNASAPRCVWIGGGLSRSAWFCTRLASALDAEVARLPLEATARGIARLTAPAFTGQWVAPLLKRFGPQSIAGLAKRRERFDRWMDRH